MAIVINPFGSISAHGKFGGLIYQSGKWGQIVKGHVPQRGKPSKLQLIQNYLFGITADKWRLLTDEQKEEWDKKASGLKMSGFNLYIKENIRTPGNVLYGTAKYGQGRYI